MFNRPLPAPARDIALLIGRVVLGVVLFAHGWQKLMINGIAGTYGQFEKMGIPLAIVSASFTSFVEFVGGVLLIVGALTTTVVALDLVVMIGAAGFIHHPRRLRAGRWVGAGGRDRRRRARAGRHRSRPLQRGPPHLLLPVAAGRCAGEGPGSCRRAEAPTTGTFAAAVRSAPGRAPQHVGQLAQGPRCGGAAQQVVGRHLRTT